MDENAIHFTTNPLNAYAPVIGGILLLAVGLFGFIFMPHATCHMPHATCHMPHATSTTIACAMFGMMTIAVGVSQFSKLDKPLVSIYPGHIISNSTRIDFHDIASYDRKGKLVLDETTHQLPLQLLGSADRFKLLKLLEERLNIEA